MIHKSATLIKNIKKYREQKNISQDKLSKLACVSLNTITKIEAGDTLNPTIKTVKKIADALNISLDKLMK